VAFPVKVDPKRTKRKMSPTADANNSLFIGLNIFKTALLDGRFKKSHASNRFFLGMKKAGFFWWKAIMV